MRMNICGFFSLLGLTQASTYTVTVGIDETTGHQGVGFDPSTIMPAVGDTIAFTFQLPEYIKNPPSVQHSATQSTFENPCTPKPGGFDTGVQGTGSLNTNTGNTYNLIVNDTQPLWFFSSVASDCKSGMILAVNPVPTGDQTAAAFLDKAMSGTGSSPIPSAISSGSETSTPASESSPPSDQTSSTVAAASTATSPAPSGSIENGAVSNVAKVELGLAAMVAVVGLAFAG